jgi:predicted RNA-binding protein associated with RNAse of E/G family
LYLDAIWREEALRRKHDHRQLILAVRTGMLNNDAFKKAWRALNAPPAPANNG